MIKLHDVAVACFVIATAFFIAVAIAAAFSTPHQAVQSDDQVECYPDARG